MKDDELLARAKIYIDKMANGINPLTDEFLEDGHLLNDVRISRCLFFVSGVLKEKTDYDNVTRGKRVSRTCAFRLTPEEIADVERSETPIGVTELAKRINAARRDPAMRSLSPLRISRWMLDKGFIAPSDPQNPKSTKLPTAAGKEIGLVETERFLYHSSTTTKWCTYSLDAQQFVLNNLDAIIGKI